MSWYHPTTILDKIFEGGLLLKGVSGAAEFLGGLLLVFFSPADIHKFITFITSGELIEDPHDKIAHLLFGWTNSLTEGMRLFLIIYLWIHATIKLIAVIGILKNQLWAYPFSLITLGLLMLYQVYTIVVKASVGMILLTLFDVFILWLIWREYGKERKILAPQASDTN